MDLATGLVQPRTQHCIRRSGGLSPTQVPNDEFFEVLGWGTAPNAGSITINSTIAVIVAIAALGRHRRLPEGEEVTGEPFSSGSRTGTDLPRSSREPTSQVSARLCGQGRCRRGALTARSWTHGW